MKEQILLITSDDVARLQRVAQLLEETQIYHILPVHFGDIDSADLLCELNLNGKKYGYRKADLAETIEQKRIPVIIASPTNAVLFKAKLAQAKLVYITSEEAGESSPEIPSRQTDLIVFSKDDSVVSRKILNFLQSSSAKKTQQHRFASALKNFLILLFVGAYLGYGINQAYFAQTKHDEQSSTPQSTTADPAASDSQKTEVAITPPTPPASTVPSAEVKKQIAKAPPKVSTAPKTPIVENTQQNADGTETTTVSTGGTPTPTDLARAAAPTSVATPTDVPFYDETGTHAELGDILKAYLRDTLRWKGEIASLKSITLRDAGASGWTGQYLGSYTVAADGKDIVSASGSIVLNSYYYQNYPIFNDYEKLTLSHEYGHHYTLYHKWVDWDLPITARFPDSYYLERPLSKSNTATDYSLGWSHCEAEIIAEDYSYIFSGYGLDAMASTFGYPSTLIRDWLDKIGDQSLLATTENLAPTLAITAPVAASTLSGDVAFTASATDDVGVAKVSFYLGDTLLAEDNASPFTTTIHTATYPNGNYVLSATASDGSLSRTETIAVTFDNAAVDTEKPTISVLVPAENPYTLATDDLDLSVQAADNVGIAKIELYLHGTLQGSWIQANLDLHATITELGEYPLRFVAYDLSGNTAEVTLVVNRVAAEASEVTTNVLGFSGAYLEARNNKTYWAQRLLANIR